VQEIPLGENQHIDSKLAVRSAHIAHEATLRSAGLLYFVAAIFLVLLAAITLYRGTPAETTTTLSDPAAAALALAIAAALAVAGYGLREIKPWARVPVMSISTLGLFYFPVGTMICGYILYMVLNQKGQVIFSQEYQGIIEATPQIGYRTPLIAWVLLGLILLILFSASLGVMLSEQT